MKHGAYAGTDQTDYETVVLNFNRILIINNFHHHLCGLTLIVHSICIIKHYQIDIYVFHNHPHWYIGLGKLVDTFSYIGRTCTGSLVT